MTPAALAADIAHKTIELPNAEAWRKIMVLLTGRVPSAAVVSVRVRVWECRKRLQRERRAASAKPPGDGASGGTTLPALPSDPGLSAPSWVTP